MPVTKAEIEKLRGLSEARTTKSKDFQDIAKEIKEQEAKKGLVKLSDLRSKESEEKKKNKDKAPKLVAKERNQPQIDEALNILADFVHMREAGSALSRKN